MITIKGARLNTIETTSNATYEFINGASGYVDIYNDTDEYLLISDAAVILSETSIIIPAGGAYSGLWFNGRLYIKSASNGKVSIVVKE